MASFPTSVFAPATKNTGDVVQASHINQLQDEVTAIEDGYLNGTARLNAGASTVATLSVTGASTFAGTAVFTLPPTLPRWPVCKVTHDAVQQIADNAFTGLSWNTNVVDSTGMHSTAVNSSRITLNSSGLWSVGVQTAWLGNTTPTHETRIHVNDDYVVAQASAAAFSLDPFVQTAAGLFYSTAANLYLTVQVRNVGSTGRVNAHSTAVNLTGPAFWAVKVSA